MPKTQGAKDKTKRSTGRWSKTVRDNLAAQKRKAEGLQQITCSASPHLPSISGSSSQDLGDSPLVNDAGTIGAGVNHNNVRPGCVRLQAGLAHGAQDAQGTSGTSGEPNAAPAPDGTTDANREDGAHPEPQPGVDFDEQDDSEAEEDESGAEAHVDSIQSKFSRLVYERLKYELSCKIPALEKKWLLESLELNEYWLRRSQASRVLRKLGAEIADFDLAYVRYIKVWLPDREYGVRPACPVCLSDEHVSAHGWRDSNDHVAQIVTDTPIDFDVMSRRYRCTTCKAARKKLQAVIIAAAATAGLRCEPTAADADASANADDDDNGDADGVGEVQETLDQGDESVLPSYTFMGYHSVSLTNMKYGKGEKFLPPISLLTRCQYCIFI
jgi:hypothetical protein